MHRRGLELDHITYSIANNGNCKDGNMHEILTLKKNGRKLILENEGTQCGKFNEKIAVFMDQVIIVVLEDKTIRMLKQYSIARVLFLLDMVLYQTAVLSAQNRLLVLKIKVYRGCYSTTMLGSRSYLQEQLSLKDHNY